MYPWPRRVCNPRTAGTLQGRMIRKDMVSAKAKVINERPCRKEVYNMKRKLVREDVYYTGGKLIQAQIQHD